MIYALSQALKTRLAAFGCPVPVIYGPERTRGATTRIVVERARGESEAINGPVGRPVNPPMSMSMQTRARIRVYAFATSSGAMTHVHERLADAIKRVVLSEMHKQIRSDKQTHTFVDGRMLTAEEAERDGLQAWPGAIYDITLALTEGVFDAKDWADAIGSVAGLDEVTIGTDVTIPAPTLHVGLNGFHARLYSGGTITFAEVGSAGDTITRASGSWLTDGFVDGDLIAIVGTTNNDAFNVEVVTVSATKLTLGTHDLTAETIATDSVLIIAYEAIGG